MKRYLTYRWGLTIDEINITRETEKSYYIPQNKGEARRNRDENYHGSWEAARNHLLDRTDYGLTFAKKEVARHEENLATIAAMVKPAETEKQDASQT